MDGVLVMKVVDGLVVSKMIDGVLVMKGIGGGGGVINTECFVTGCV